MPGRKIVDAQDARRCLEAAAASGLTRRDWAVASGIDARSLNMWRLVLRRGSAPTQTADTRFVELVAVDAPPRPARFVIRVGAASIEVDEAFDQHALHRLLQVVSSCWG